MIFTGCLNAEESPHREVCKQNDSTVMIFHSKISVFIFKQKGKLSRPISVLLNPDKLHPPTFFESCDNIHSTLDHFKKNKI